MLIQVVTGLYQSNRLFSHVPQVLQSVLQLQHETRGWLLHNVRQLRPEAKHRPTWRPHPLGCVVEDAQLARLVAVRRWIDTCVLLALEDRITKRTR
jgi:hypothetical protein